MKKKIMIMIFVLIEISLMFINTVYADANYYEIKYETADGKEGETLKIDKNKIKNATDKSEIKALVNQVYWINPRELTAGGVEELNKLLGEFYQGAYQNLDNADSYKSDVYDTLFKYTPGSTAYRLAEQAEKKAGPNNAQNRTEYDKLMKIASDLRSGTFVPTGNIQPPSSAATGQNGDVTHKETEEKKQNSSSIYQLPKKQDSASADDLDDILSDGETFIQAANKDIYKNQDLQKVSSAIYNILLTVGVAIALIVGIIIGIKYMMGSIEEKANYKQMLLPYVVGCVVVFGAFGIWKLVVTIIESV